jgi:hypothetical protein
MAASDILGLFTTPQQYERQRQADMEAQALQVAKLSPREQGQFGIALGAQQLGRAIGGALGGVDPQLQKITQRQQLLGMIDPNNPDSYAQAIQTALQAGDQEAAFLLRNEMMRLQEQASVAENRRLEREGRLLERGFGMQKRGMESMALSIANGIDPETGDPIKPLFDPITRTFNQDVADQLISRFPKVGADIVKTRLESVQGIGSLQEKQAAKKQEEQAQEKSKLLFKEDGTIDQNVYIELMTNFGQAGLDVLEKKLKGVQGVESLQEKQAAKSRTDKANELFGRLRKPDGTIDEEVKAQLLSFQEGRNLIEEQAKVLKPLRQLGAVGGAPEEDPFKIFLDDPTIPANVKTLAGQYSASFGKGMIDPDKVDARVEKLTDMTQRIQQFEQNQAQIKATQDSMAALREQNLQNSQAYLALAKSQLALSRQNAAFQQRMKLDEATAKAEKAKDGKEIKFGDATKLAGQSTGVDNLVGIYESFKPEFAGFGTNAVGEVAVFAAGKQSDEKSVALYQWWQDYQTNINKVRNDLFGSALTAPEKVEFEKAMVTKGMNSTQAEKNLRRQAEIAQKAYDKIDNVLRVQGYSKAALDALKPTGIRPPMSNFVID